MKSGGCSCYDRAGYERHPEVFGLVFVGIAWRLGIIGVVLHHNGVMNASSLSKSAKT